MTEATGSVQPANLVRLRLITHNARLVDARKERRMTQLDLALAIGTNQNHMSEIETLKVNPTVMEMVDITSFLEKPMDYLFPEDLLSAVEAGVFFRRKVELGALEVISLTEAQRRHLLPVSGQHDVEEEAESVLMASQVRELVKTLQPREQRVLTLRFGLDGRGSRTLEDVGLELQVTRERIRQIEEKALRKLRHPRSSRKLVDYLD